MTEVHDSNTRIHLQRLFEMPDNEYSGFNVDQLLSDNIRGKPTFLAFGWTALAERGANHVIYEDLFYGYPNIMMKIYMAAQLWLRSVVLFPYLMSL